MRGESFKKMSLLLGYYKFEISLLIGCWNKGLGERGRGGGGLMYVLEKVHKTWLKQVFKPSQI